MAITTKTKRKPKPYQRIIELPPLADDQLEGLRNSIGVAGVKVPIIIDENKQIIDGWHRKMIADELEYDCPEIVEEGLSEEDKRTLARALNLARRQLTQEQKRQVVADQLLESPERSNRWIAKQLGVGHPLVSRVRKELETGGTVPAGCCHWGGRQAVSAI